MIGLNKTLKGLHVFGTDGEKAWIDAFHHEFKFAVHLTCFELCGVIWRKNCRNTWFLIANLKSKILNDIFGRQVGSTLFTGVIDSKSEAVFKQIKDQASSGQVEAKNSKETNWATPREMEAICMHQGQDFQSNHHEIGPWTEPESYMELSANGHTWLSFFRIHFLYFILFFFCLFLVWHQPCLCAGIVTLVSVQFVMYMQLKKAFWAETSHFITVSSATCNASTNSLSSEPLWH